MKKSDQFVPMTFRKSRFFAVPTSLLAIGLVVGTSSTHAATITGVTIEDVSSEFSDVPGVFRSAGYLIDGSGLSGNTHSTVIDTMWLTTGTFQAPNDPLPAQVTFDLEGNYDLNSFTQWNYNENNGAGFDGTSRGANSVTISVADAVGGSFTSLGTFAFDRAPSNNTTDFGQLINLSGFTAADNVRLIRFDITSTHGGDNGFAGLSEVRFDGIAVPEPSAALLGGLGCLLLVRRRRA